MLWKLPNGTLMAFVPRTGSTAWAQAIINKFYPDLKAKQAHMARPDGFDPSELPMPQFVLPQETHPAKDAKIVGAMRNPIDRFLSGYSRAAGDLSVDDFIAQIDQPGKLNIHIRPVTDLTNRYPNIQWYCYETKLADLATAIGLDKVSRKSLGW